LDVDSFSQAGLELLSIMASYKMKTNRSATKRFRVTGTGKVKRKRNHLSHILTTHPRKVKRRYRKKTYVRDTEMGHMKVLMPYAF
jgi:large subunit ribosomal protein L35